MTKTHHKIISICLVIAIGAVAGFGYIFKNAPQASASCGGGYSFCRPITLDHTKIGNGTEDETYFPWEASSTIASLATVGNGGHVNHTTTQTGSSYTGTVPADAIFTSDSACSTKLDWEWEAYNSATGNFVVWIANPTTALSHTSDTVVYLCYGGSATTWQGNVNGTWNSNYSTVWHFPNGTTLNSNDSTSNAYNSNGGGGTINATSTIIDGGASFVGSGNIRYPSNAIIPSGAAARTISGWIKGWNSAQTCQSVIVTGTNNAGAGKNFDISIRNNGGNVLGVGGGGGGTDESGSIVMATTTWNSIIIVYNGTTLTSYVNGVQDINTSVSYNTLANNTYLGSDTTANCFDYSGLLDEVRISTVALSTGWVKTEYNNQSAPDKANYGSGGFYTVGSEQSSGGGGGPTTKPQMIQFGLDPKQLI